MFKKFFHKSPKNEEKAPRDPYFKNSNVTTITKAPNFPHHSSSHSPFRTEKNETNSQGSYQNPSNTAYKPSTVNYSITNSDKIPKPNYESQQKISPIQPPDLKESFSNMMGSISEHTNEGNNLVQNLPCSKDVYASKIPISDGINTHLAFKIVNKDTGFDLLFKN